MPFGNYGGLSISPPDNNVLLPCQTPLKSFKLLDWGLTMYIKLIPIIPNVSLADNFPRVYNTDWIFAWDSYWFSRYWENFLFEVFLFYYLDLNYWQVPSKFSIQVWLQELHLYSYSKFTFAFRLKTSSR